MKTWNPIARVTTLVAGVVALSLAGGLAAAPVAIWIMSHVR